MPAWLAFALVFASTPATFGDENDIPVPWAPPENASTGQQADPGSSPENVLAPALATPIETDEDRDLARQLEGRMAGRLSLDLNLGFSALKHHPEVGAPINPTARILLGYRKHSRPHLGFHLRGGALLGIPWARRTGNGGARSTITTRLVGATVDGVVIFGPFGRFYVGPALSLDYVRFRDTTLYLGDGTVHLTNGVSVGLGFDIGFALGEWETVSVYNSFRMSEGAEAMFLFVLGIGYLI